MAEVPVEQSADSTSATLSSTEKEDSVYNLLLDEDPEEFVTVEIPVDINSVASVQVPHAKKTGRNRLLGKFGRKNSPKVHKRQRSPVNSDSSGDVPVVSADQIMEASLGDVEIGLTNLSVSHRDVHSHYHSPGRLDSGEEQTGTAGILLVNSDSCLTEVPATVDSDARSDMLMSLGMGVADMSVRHSIHIGVSGSDLKLASLEPISLPPADETMAHEATRSRLDSIEADRREFENEDVDSTTWCQHKKHVFVLSISGKPVYSRYGKEDKLVNLFGIMQAIVSFIQDDSDNLRSIVAGGHRFVFMCRGPLVFVSVSQSKQSDSQLAIQLSFAYYQILSVLTNTQLTQRFDRQPGFDLRNLLQGSEKFIDNILNMSDSDPSFLFNGIRCLSMPLSLRQGITNHIIQSRSKDVLFVILIANDQLVTFVRPKEHNLVPIDIHLILNLVKASQSFRSAESWTPICLPKFNDSGFLHTHVSYLPNDSPACLLLFSIDKEKFFDLQQCQMKIVEKLEKSGQLEGLKQAVKKAPYDINDFLQAHEVRHFMYKSRKTSCLSSPEIPQMYSNPEDKNRLFRLYMSLHQRIQSSTWPTKIIYHVGEKEALLAWRTTGFDLYIIFDPLISKTQAILLGNKLIQWIDKNEDKLVLTTTYTF